MELSGKIFPNAQKPKKHVVNTPAQRFENSEEIYKFIQLNENCYRIYEPQL